MKTHFSVVSALLVVLLATTGPVAAQELPGSTPTPTPETTPETPAETIDSNTRLVSAEYDSDTESVTVVVESDVLQEIVVSDAGAFMQGGEVEQRKVTAKPGERTTIVMPVTKARGGYVGVSIATRDTLYAVPIETETYLFQGEAAWRTAQLAGFGAVVGTLAITGVLAWRRRSGGRSEVNQIA